MALKLNDFDPAKYLETDADIAEYLSEIINAGDAALPATATAMGDIARSRGMTEIARASGITREALYKALQPDAQPRLETIARVCTARGLKLQVTVAA
jgi:probable addiction module antidote protein